MLVRNSQQSGIVAKLNKNIPQTQNFGGKEVSDFEDFRLLIGWRISNLSQV